MKKFWLVFGIVFLAMVALGVLSSQAKDLNNLDQYDDQTVADILKIIDDQVYPLAKIFWPGWVKLDQGKSAITSDQRLLSIYSMMVSVNQYVEALLYTNIINDSSCGEEGIVTIYSWQMMFGGLPGYVYFLPEKAKLKIERAVLQADGSGKTKNIVCARDVVGLDGVVSGQEEYIKSVLSGYFPDFVWGNFIWNPNEKVSFGVEVISLPAEYLLPAK